MSDLCFSLDGGADEGLFPQVDRVDDNIAPGDLLERVRPGAVLLEVQGQSVAGYTLADVTAWLRHCLKNRNPVVIRTAPKGRPNCKKECTHRSCRQDRDRKCNLIILPGLLETWDIILGYYHIRDTGACCIKCYELICSQESYEFRECYTQNS